MQCLAPAVAEAALANRGKCFLDLLMDYICMHTGIVYYRVMLGEADCIVVQRC